MNTHKKNNDPIKSLEGADLNKRKVFRLKNAKKRNKAAVLAELSPGSVNLKMERLLGRIKFKLNKRNIKIHSIHMTLKFLVR
jgi:hypothetical protein